ncbi:hypothetical protein C9374_013852 [Naegleria lovaniensis]|uniref:Guanylate cyclase domain-containing protein n=1 Tax=Naegleria lovaniensis TaxID=51637 RepID=A0AA88KUM7_NAELO|nr:uncharacterized protein C9374_013852 [Naegleria lovaniensis]KAG2389292.1 hypothetical protein C9374_013852 [Naegleria lovaniensis]
MPKISPETSEASKPPLDEKQDLLFEETANASQEGLLIKEKKKVPLEACFSMRVVIIIMIIFLLVTCSVFIWLASFIGSNQTFTELADSLVSQVGQKILAFVDGQVTPISGLAWAIASEFTMGRVGRRPISYLFNMNEIYRFSSIGVYFADEMYTYLNQTYFPNGVPTQQFVLGYKQAGWPGIELWNANETDGSKLTIYQNISSFSVVKRDYWVASFKYFDLYKRDGVYGDSYVATGSSNAIYYSAKLFDPDLYALNKTKKVVGISKVNLSLLAIQNFLSSLKLIGNGYVVVAEPNDLVLGGSINTTARDSVSRVSLFGLTDRNSGSLMRDIRDKYGNMSNIPNFFQITSLGTDYMIYKMEYKTENLRWLVYMVIYKEDVTRTSTINTGISVGVAAAVIIVGLIMCVLIGHIITQPYLKAQFKKIKKFDLEKVHFTSSRFKEIDSIYEDLHDMVTWLHEFKSFLPETIFNQLRNFEQQVEADDSEEKVKSSADHAQQHAKTDGNTKKQLSDSQSKVGDDAENSLASSSAGGKFSFSNSHQESHRKHESGGLSALFKLGLQEKEVSVVTIRIQDMCKNLTATQVSHIFAKIATGLSVLSKSMQADLQVLSVDEYQLSFTNNGKKKANVQALTAALKVSKTLDNSLNGIEKATVCIGIASGETNIGNLGTNTFRFYSIVGPLIETSKKLSILCRVRKCRILADAKTMSAEAKSAFVVRPVERLMIEDEKFKSSVSSIYEVIKESNVEGDEWMYELEQHKENSRFKDFEAAFSIFESSQLSSMEDRQVLERIHEAQNILQTHAHKHPQDADMANRLLKVLDSICKQHKEDGHLGDALMNYHSVLRKSVDEFTSNAMSDERLLLNSYSVME